MLGGQRGHGLAHGVAVHAEALGELALGGQLRARCPGAADDLAAQLLGDEPPGGVPAGRPALRRHDVRNSTHLAVLDALAHPTRSYPLAGPAEPPAALGRGLAAVALTLLDEDCVVWLGGELGHDVETAAWLAFHTGARRTADPAAAGFVIATPDALPPLASLALGTDEAPHLSATVVLDVRGYSGPTRFTAQGPGIDGIATLTAPWVGGLTAPRAPEVTAAWVPERTTPWAPDGFIGAWRRNTELFPRGVDLLLVDAGTVTALPRTTRLTASEDEQAVDTEQED